MTHIDLDPNTIDLTVIVYHDPIEDTVGTTYLHTESYSDLSAIDLVSELTNDQGIILKITRV